MSDWSFIFGFVFDHFLFINEPGFSYFLKKIKRCRKGQEVERKRYFLLRRCFFEYQRRFLAFWQIFRVRVFLGILQEFL